MEDRKVRVNFGSVLPAGDSFEVVAMRPGVANGLTFTEDVLRRSVEMRQWEGAAMFVDHAGLWDWGRSVEDVAGVLRETRFDDGVRGVMRCMGPKGKVIQAFAADLVAERDAGGVLPDVGLSADLILRIDAQDQVVDIVAVNSVDVVVSPAAGGAFLRAVHSVQGGKAMGTEAKVETPALGGGGEPAVKPAVDVEGLALLGCGHALDVALAGSGLPAASQAVVRQRFGGRLFQASELSAEIETQRALLAGLLEAGVVRGLGASEGAGKGSGATVTEATERLQAAWERCLGLKVAERFSDVPRLSGIRELYLMLTGDSEFRGVYDPERVTFANATRTTMAGVVTDGLNKVLVNAFNRREKWYLPIIVEQDLDRYQDMKLIRPYGFAALDTVVEGNPYTEKVWDDVKETASLVKKGNYIGLTLEMIMSDDIGAVRRIPELLGSAAYNALADAVSAIFTANAGVGPTMADGVALFDAGGHANLLTAALDETAFGAAATAMMVQTEPGSGRRLGAKPAYLLVPASLWATATVLRNTKLKTGSANNDVNPWFETFDVIQVPPWTDTNDWALVADPKEYPAITVGYLFGKREPEMFVADSELMGSMFTNDELRIKARWFFSVGVADYRPLHKNNVT